MADGSLFAADPSRIKAGGDATGQVADMTDRTAEQFRDDTSFDPGDPPWGNDSYGSQYVQNYVPAHNLINKGILDLARAMAAAGALTVDSGKSFENAQHDNTHAISDLPEPDVHTTPHRV
ncbi:hypothetical protein [Streptomyces humi]|uniref:hypothetical protein n=1 Tax=Streptomyces humi TaxID=1428620 RepID=UPI00062880CA|nr:hypothetical protein [Streptomyces humi]